MRKISNEVKTGVMVAVCLLILLGFTAKITGPSTFKKGYSLQVQFNYANALKKGAPVYLTGVEVGEVKDVRIIYSDEGTNARFTVWLDKGAKVREDSKAYIAMMGLMGEKYLEFSRGSKESPFLKEGSLVIGKEPMMMEEMMDKAMSIADNLNGGISDLRKLMKDVNVTVTDNRPQIDEIIKNMNETSNNFKEFSDEIRRAPWKLLMKTKEKKEEPRAEIKKEVKGNMGSFYKKGE